MTVTVHYISSELKMISKALSTLYLETNHTADYVKSELLDIAQSWKVAEKVVAIVTDNGSNIVTCRIVTTIDYWRNRVRWRVQLLGNRHYIHTVC